MNRIEELTMKLADEATDSEEEAELRTLLAGDEHARHVHLRLLEIEVALRGTSGVPIVAEETLRRLRTELFHGIEQGVMERIRVLPEPSIDNIGSRRREEADPPAESRASSAFSRRRRRGDSDEPSNVINPGLEDPRRLRRVEQVLAIAAVFALFLGLKIWLLPPVSNEPTLVLAPASAVTIERGTETFAARDQMKLRAGDVVNVSGTNKVSLNYGNEPTIIAVNPGTDLRVLAWSSGKHFELRNGRIEASVARQRPWQPMIWHTAQAAARVLGTKFTLAATTNATRLDVTEGKVRFTRTTDGEAVKVPAGHYAVATKNYDLASLPQTGGIFRESWTNIPGGSLQNLITHTNYPARPDSTGYLTNLSSFELPSNQGENYGERLRGYVHPPQTGEYTFWIAATDEASLWLSPDDSPGNKLHMAHCWNAKPGDWLSKAQQQSASVPLTAGQTYYFEVLHKAGIGDDDLALAWQGPGREREVIPIGFLSPFEPGR